MHRNAGSGLSGSALGVGRVSVLSRRAVACPAAVVSLIDEKPNERKDIQLACQYTFPFQFSTNMSPTHLVAFPYHINSLQISRNTMPKPDFGTVTYIELKYVQFYC